MAEQVSERLVVLEAEHDVLMQRRSALLEEARKARLLSVAHALLERDGIRYFVRGNALHRVDSENKFPPGHSFNVHANRLLIGLKRLEINQERGTEGFEGLNVFPPPFS